MRLDSLYIYKAGRDKIRRFQKIGLLDRAGIAGRKDSVKMAISLGKIGWLLIAWAFFFALATVGMNIATLLMIVGTVLYLVG